MSDSRSQHALRAALQFVMSGDIPSEHKVVLIDVLTQALRNEDAAAAHLKADAQPSAEWRPHETAQLRTALAGAVATSWQHADELAMRLSVQLHRRPEDIRAKARELGLGVAVDFREARASLRSDED